MAQAKKKYRGTRTIVSNRDGICDHCGGPFKTGEYIGYKPGFWFKNPETEEREYVHPKVYCFNHMRQEPLPLDAKEHRAQVVAQ